MSLSYEYSIGSVRAKEISLLTRQDYDHLLALNSEKEIAAWLQSKGYGEGERVDEILAAHRARLWDYIASVAPDPHVFDCFLIENDVHNLKTVMKGILAGRAYEPLLLRPATVDPQTVVQAVSDQKFDLLPAWAAEPARNAYRVLAHTFDARASDALLDRAAMEQMLALSAASGAFLHRYFRTRVFFFDVKLALRAARTGADSAFLQSALCPVEGLDLSALEKAALKGEEALVEWLLHRAEYGCNRALEAYRTGGGSAFEKQVEELLLAAAAQCKRASEGAEPLIGYLLASENELKSVHIIVSSVATGLSAEAARERLRGIYE